MNQNQIGYTPGDMADQGAKQFDAGMACGTALAQLAGRIADRTARSDIEAYAKWVKVDGQSFCDTNQAEDPRDPDAMLYVQLALKYIELRGDAWEWRLQRHADLPHLVRFVERES